MGFISQRDRGERFTDGLRHREIIGTNTSFRDNTETCSEDKRLSARMEHSGTEMAPRPWMEKRFNWKIEDSEPDIRHTDEVQVVEPDTVQK